jgi:hypothetical protein
MSTSPPAKILAASLNTGSDPSRIHHQVRTWRDEGRSWPQIVALMDSRYGVTVSRRSLAAWAPDPEGFDVRIPRGRARNHPRLPARDVDQLTRLRDRVLAAASKGPCANYPHVAALLNVAAHELDQIITVPVPSLPRDGDRPHPPASLAGAATLEPEPAA